MPVNRSTIRDLLLPGLSQIVRGTPSAPWNYAEIDRRERIALEGLAMRYIKDDLGASVIIDRIEAWREPTTDCWMLAVRLFPIDRDAIEVRHQIQPWDGISFGDQLVTAIRLALGEPGRPVEPEPKRVGRDLDLGPAAEVRAPITVGRVLDI